MKQAAKQIQVTYTMTKCVDEYVIQGGRSFTTDKDATKFCERLHDIATRLSLRFARQEFGLQLTRLSQIYRKDHNSRHHCNRATRDGWKVIEHNPIALKVSIATIKPQQ